MLRFASFLLLIVPGVQKPNHKSVEPTPFIEFGLAEQIEWRGEWRAQQTQMCPDDEHITCSRFTVFI